MLAALIRPIFNADSGEQARERLSEALQALERPLLKLAALLEQAEEDLLALYAFPAPHWSKLRSTNPLERVNREIGRRTDVVGIFLRDLLSLTRPARSCPERWVTRNLPVEPCRLLTLLGPVPATSGGVPCDLIVAWKPNVGVSKTPRRIVRHSRRRTG
jgi:hypothetical protein